jgi:hypothetical protein
VLSVKFSTSFWYSYLVGPTANLFIRRNWYISTRYVRVRVQKYSSTYSKVLEVLEYARLPTLYKTRRRRLLRRTAQNSVEFRHFSTNPNQTDFRRIVIAASQYCCALQLQLAIIGRSSLGVPTSKYCILIV